MVDLTRHLLDELVETYEERVPFFLVETERLETLPDALRAGSLMWKDAEWVLRWYYRRHLDSRYNDERQRAERAFRRNGWDAVRSAILAAVEADELADRIEHLTDLEGIDVPIATGFLFFFDPEQDIVMGPREWRGLTEAHELRRSYPGRPGVPDYATYRRTCRELARRLDVGFPTLYRALWRLGTETAEG